MYIENTIHKDNFEKNGYVIIDNNLENNQNFEKITQEINLNLKLQLKDNNLKNISGYLMGNLGINQGQYGLKLYSIIFKEEFIKIFENLTEIDLNSFDINYGGNLVLPKKGQQHFHIDGFFNKKMYLVSIATEDVTLQNGPTEVCIGSHKNQMKYWEFFLSKKNKKKILLKKGQILIRKHNLWHRGTRNNSNQARLLLSFIMTPKINANEIEPLTSNIKILPNFFKPGFLGKIQEILYVNFRTIHLILKIINSIIKQK